MSIRDQIIVITGAGSGLGRALAAGMVRHGATVIGLGSREAPLRETESLIGDNHFSWYVVDVADAAQVEEAVQQIAGRFGRIDVLFNNAAVYPKTSFFEQDAASWMRAIAVNVGGVANCCRAVLPLMMRQGKGRVINVGSFADLAPIPDSSAYAASKGAVRALTKAIHADLGSAHPGVTCLEWIPGHLNTQMSDYTGMDPAACVEWAIQLINLPPWQGRPRIFEGDHEQLPPQSLKSRLKAKLLFWKH
jgi:NAD(P)-dependent dehydrogenase (short-subunit alcohol dehydrogenase family)